MNQLLAKAYGAADATAQLAPISIPRREPGAYDVSLEILYCGVCHSDIHQARNEWGGTLYPCVPGHEITGRVRGVGPAVRTIKPGDLCAVGCLVDACRSCTCCLAGMEQYCLAKPTYTYNSPDKHLGGHTLGGYSTHITVDEAFVLHVPQGMDLAATAPLLCAGVTTWSPLRAWNVGPGMQVGIIGLGGLGHMAVKFARALGAHVTLFTTSPAKVDDALRLGAHQAVISTDAAAMRPLRRQFHFILDTVSAPHDLDTWLKLLALDGTLTLVGLPDQPLPVSVFNLTGGRHRLAGSSIGGIRESQEMLAFCAAHGIASDIELITMDKVNEAWERLLRQDVRYRFVIDMASLHP
jgi:uncharacterized zinc-type alcohol dehydrogenase-like protein